MQSGEPAFFIVPQLLRGVGSGDHHQRAAGLPLFNSVEGAANQSGVDISRTRAADHEPRWDGTAISSTRTGHEPEKGRL